MPIGRPGGPERAFSTASTARKRMGLTARRARAGAAPGLELVGLTGVLGSPGRRGRRSAGRAADRVFRVGHPSRFDHAPPPVPWPVRRGRGGAPGRAARLLPLPRPRRAPTVARVRRMHLDGARVTPVDRTPLELTVPELRRYGRHLTLPEVGEAGQQRLKAARVLVDRKSTRLNSS